MIHTRYPADVLVSMEDPNHMVDMDTFLADELKSVPGGSYTSYAYPRRQTTASRWRTK